MPDDPHDPMMGDYSPAHDKYRHVREDYDDPYEGQKPGMFQSWKPVIFIAGFGLTCWIIIVSLIVVRYW